MQASPAADHVGSMNARLIFRQEAVNDAGAAQPRMPEFDTWVLLRKSVAEISCFCQRKRALPVHDPSFRADARSNSIRSVVGRELSLAKTLSTSLKRQVLKVSKQRTRLVLIPCLRSDTTSSKFRMISAGGSSRHGNAIRDVSS
jgi:hypothetical protein